MGLFSNTTMRRSARTLLLLACLGAGAAGLGACGSTTSSATSSSSPSTSTSTNQAKIFSSTLTGIDCITPALCQAVGSYLLQDADAAKGDPDGDELVRHSLVESLDGSAWQVMHSPNVGKGGSQLTGVSCATAQTCIAVGYYEPFLVRPNTAGVALRKPLIEAFNGSTWTIAHAPQVSSNSVLLGVSCPSVRSCVAVGYTTLGTSSHAFVESFDGTSWHLVTVPMPSGRSNLSGVVCPTPVVCLAVGSATSLASTSGAHPWAEVLSGGHWTSDLIATPADVAGILYGVACITVDRCYAVGQLATSVSTSAALVISFNGASFDLEPSSPALYGVGSLLSISCGVTLCIGGGTFAKSPAATSVPLVVDVGANSWHRLAANATGTLSDVSCPNDAQCLFVGTRNDQAFIAAFDNDVWSGVTSPTP